MIIDADTHIAPTGGEFAVERHLERMECAGIDKALVWLKPDYHGTEIEGHNRYVYQATRQYPDRLIGFGWADPTVGIEHALKMVRVCTEEYGFCGVKMNGAQNRYFIDDPQIALPVAEAIAKTGKALAFHIGADEYERTHPLRAAKIAKMFPETPILMVHMGMADPMMNRVTIEVAQECPNMYLVGSATTYQAIVQAIQTLGADRVLFGTDAPFQWPHVVKAMYDAALDGLFSAEEKARVMGGNLARVLRLNG